MVDFNSAGYKRAFRKLPNVVNCLNISFLLSSSGRAPTHPVSPPSTALYCRHTCPLTRRLPWQCSARRLNLSIWWHPCILVFKTLLPYRLPLFYPLPLWGALLHSKTAAPGVPVRRYILNHGLIQDKTREEVVIK